MTKASVPSVALGLWPLRGPDFGDLFKRIDEFAPHAPARAEHLAARRREAIEAAAPLAGFFHPAAGHPALFLELVEQGIERGRLEAELAARPRLDDLRQFIPMPIRAVENRQHQELGAAFLQRLCGDICHIGMKHTYLTETRQERLARDRARQSRDLGGYKKSGWPV